MHVLLNTIEKVKQFVRVASNFEIKAYLKSGKYVVDASSILGVFSLDLTQPIELTFDVTCQKDVELARQYTNQVAEFAA